jgi:hypothetical protein
MIDDVMPREWENLVGQNGTAEERAAVRAALEALALFNRKVQDCQSLGIEVRLEALI